MPKYVVVEVHEKVIRFEVEAPSPEEAAEAAHVMDVSTATYEGDQELQYVLVYDDNDFLDNVVYDSREEDAEQRQHDIAVTAAINEALQEEKSHGDG